MGPKTQELVGVLDELIDLLEGDGDLHWSEWMRLAQSRLRNSDFGGIEAVLGAYGGMGSINDLVLGQTTRDGAFEWKPGHVEINARFDELRLRAFELAELIKKSHEVRGR